MKRISALFALVALAVSSGCCASRCNPCSTGGGYGYGASYAPSYQQQQYMQPSCPTGNCGSNFGGGFNGGYYPSGSLQPIPQQAMMPDSTVYSGTTTAYMQPNNTVAMDYLPAF